MAFYPDAFGLMMFGAVFVLLLVGFPVAFTLMGTAIAFAFLGGGLGLFDVHLLSALPLRILGIMDNDLLQAIPLFLYLGVILQRTTLAAGLLEAMSGLFGTRAGGLGISTLIIGALLAPTTGAVGATVLTIGLLGLPTMLEAGYDRRLACGIVCSAGTLGTILPPSIVLILLGDLMQHAHIEEQLARGQLVVSAMTVKDLYLGAIGPVGLLLGLYLLYVAAVAVLFPRACPPLPVHLQRRPALMRLLVVLVVPVGFIVAMLGSIITGYIYTVEAAAIGAVCATTYALLRGELNLERMAETVRSVAKLTAMVFLLLIGASTFSLVFRGFSGDVVVTWLLSGLPGGISGAVIVVMAIMFVLGFFLDALEIILLVVPIAMPPLLHLGADPVWLAMLTAINLQTSFLHPPFGFALFFLRGVAPPEVRTSEIYLGVVPFIAIQVVALVLIWSSPKIVETLPESVNAPASATGPQPATKGEVPPLPDYRGPDVLPKELRPGSPQP